MRKNPAAARGKAMGMAALLGMAKGPKPPAKKAAARPPRKAGKPKRGSVPPIMLPMGGGGMGPLSPMGM